MDELEFLKQNWKKQEESLPKLSYDQIYKMLWKKSSSIVRWIFVISILELLLSTMISIFFADGDYWANMEEIQLKEFTIGLYIFSYSVTFYFIYKFYKNYQKISTTDDAATLMKNIINTRKTVKAYIAFVLISTGASSIVYLYFTIANHQVVTQVKDTTKYSYEAMDWVKFSLTFIVVMVVFLCALWLFYKLIYGILLRRLNRNYKELKKLEV